ncbi:MAG: hypothetical protein U0935_12495 [Pirellulales bacterium]
MPVSEPAGRCWVCGNAASPLLGRWRRIGSWNEDRLQFRLDTLLLTVTLLSAALALARVLPRETIALIGILAPAYLRVALRVQHCQTLGERIGPGRKMYWFATSTIIVTAIAAAGSTAALLAVGLGVGIGRLVEWWYEQDLLGVLWIILGASAGMFTGLAGAAWATARLWPWPVPSTGDVLQPSNKESA